ncbi:LssY C-terminal domain-containing protein, partial [Patescibacteria group bacterium]|nr:LssY C-terminal domain-containing protein [Patescibacteria group bacterium]
PTYSFPSGHATTAVAFYGFVTYLLMSLIKSRRRKIHIFFVGFVLIFLIDFSRLYLGVHYLSDVWGGDLVGLLWLIIGISMAEWALIKIGKGPKILPFAKKKKTSASLIIASLVVYIVSVIYYQPELMTVHPPLAEKVVNNIEEIFSDNHLRYTETLSGAKQEPLSFIILAKDDDAFITIFEKAGWSLADSINLHSTIEIAKTAIAKKPYHTAPMTPSFWNLEVHNFGFEKATSANSVRQRHHARFWRTNYITKDGQQIYIGTASLDSGIKWGITHKISPDIDTERDYLLADIIRENPEMSYKKKPFVDPVLGQNFVGDQFFSDGQAYFLQ